jgi:hypothetical protein
LRKLVSTAASWAWLAVAAVGVVVVALVIALQLIPRLTAGQEVIDAAKPAMTDSAVKGEVAATKLVARYVDLADPLMTRRGDAEREIATLVRLVARKTGGSSRRARALLRREAPHTEALLRALPFSGIASERPRLTRLLSQTLNLPAEDLQDEIARTFPRLYQTLSELPGVSGGWYDIPGIERMTRFDDTTRVRTMPALRDYLRDDLVATVGEQQDHFAYLAGWGGIGYIPYLVLIAGIVLFAFGVLEARRAANYPPGKLAWGGVVAVGVLLALIVGALQYVPRLNGADTMISELQPAFERARVDGLRAGTDLTVQAVRFGDPIMTRAGGAAQEYPKLVALVSERSGLSRKQVRRRLARAAPRTTALLGAIPLSAAAKELPHLLAVLSRTLDLRNGRLGRTLRKRTPGLTQALLALRPVTAGWEQIPGTDELERFDGVTPVRSAPAFADYLDRDVVPVLESQREHFDTLADTWPPVSVFGWLLLGVGLFVAIYGVTMMFLVTKPPPRY